MLSRFSVLRRCLSTTLSTKKSSINPFSEYLKLNKLLIKNSASPPLKPEEIKVKAAQLWDGLDAASKQKYLKMAEESAALKKGFNYKDEQENLFFFYLQLNKESIKNSSSVLLTSEEIEVKAAQLWEELDADSKQKYYELFKENQEPKRPINAFIVYVQMNKESIKNSTSPPLNRYNKILEKGGQMWKELDEATKEKYQQIFEERKALRETDEGIRRSDFQKKTLERVQT